MLTGLASNGSFRHPSGRTARTEVSNGHRMPGDPVERNGAPMSFARNAQIYGENEPADHLYKVVSGAVRTCKVRADGRRQIGAFYLPGEIFGLEGGDEHAFSAEAVIDARVLVINRHGVLSLAGSDNDVARQIWALMARELGRCTGSRLPAYQDRTGARGQLSARARRAHPIERRGGATHVTPRHRRLSGSHDRNCLPHADAIRGRIGDRPAHVQADRPARPCGPEAAGGMMPPARHSSRQNVRSENVSMPRNPGRAPRAGRSQQFGVNHVDPDR